MEQLLKKEILMEQKRILICNKVLTDVNEITPYEFASDTLYNGIILGIANSDKLKLEFILDIIRRKEKILAKRIRGCTLITSSA